MPYLGLNVAEKMGKLAELLAVLSGSDKTASSCRAFLNFLSRLKGQAAEYRTARNLGSSPLTDPQGAFEYCRLMNHDYMVSLSGAKNRNLTFLWMYIQRNLEIPTDAKDVKESDRIFSGIPDGTINFLARFGRDIINRYYGGEIIRFDNDRLMALLTKKEMIDEQKTGRSSNKYTRIASATAADRNQLPAIPTPKPTVTGPSMSAFESMVLNATKK